MYGRRIPVLFDGLSDLLLIGVFRRDCFLVRHSAVFSEEEDGYARVTGPCRLEFPADHGAHPDFRTEWWYYTGNLETEEGRPFGFQLTIFRRQISPPEARKEWPDPPSAWRTQQVYLGHAALTDISDGRHYSAEDIARGALQLAGVRQTPDTTTVFLKRWRIRIGPQGHKLSAVFKRLSTGPRSGTVKTGCPARGSGLQPQGRFGRIGPVVTILLPA